MKRRPQAARSGARSEAKPSGGGWRAAVRAPGPASQAPGPVRLAKLIASAGLASRRDAETWLRDGRVTVNGEVVREPGVRADPRADRIHVDGRPLGRPPTRRYYVLHKPRGVVTTTRDRFAKRTVLDLVPARERLFPVGRLDAASEGLVLLTNDGALAQVLQHPSFEVPRTYRVSVRGRVPGRTLERLARGLVIEGRRTAPCEVRVLREEEERSVLEMRLVEGRRRQIREMLRAVGHPVLRLQRVAFGPIRLGGLRPGAWRPLERAERAALERMLAAGRPAGVRQRSRQVHAKKSE